MFLFKRYLIVVMLLLMTITCVEAEQLLNYGFENWNVTAEQTPGYIFSNSPSGHWPTHENSSEVVTGYNGWTPRSGSYMFLQSDSHRFHLSPRVQGITMGAINGHNNISLNGPFGGDHPLNIIEDIQTGEIFIRFWARMNSGFGTIADRGRCKWIRIYTNGGKFDTVYMQLLTDPGPDSAMHFFCHNALAEGEDNLGPGVALPNAYDGNWHKYAMYVNWNEGVIRGWYDVAEESAENATKEWQSENGRIGEGSRPAHFLIQANFSSKEPTEMTYHALDDIEVWDGMPDADQVSPDPPQELRVIN